MNPIASKGSDDGVHDAGILKLKRRKIDGYSLKKTILVFDTIEAEPERLREVTGRRSLNIELQAAALDW